MALVYSPTTRGRLLALELRRLRERSGLEQAGAAKALAWSKSKLSRIEGAEVKVTEVDILALLQLYGAGERADTLIRLRKDSWQRGWWTAYSDAFTGPFVALEDQATRILTWETQLVPGLLQTKEYAHALIGTLRHDEDPKVVHDRVTARINRQRILDRPDAPEYRAVLDESILRRQIGSAEITRDQLSHLVEMGRRPNITIQVMPFTAQIHPGLDGPMTLFSFASDDDLDVAYAEGLGGDVYLESATELRRIRVATQSIGEAALLPEESLDHIAALAKE